MVIYYAIKAWETSIRDQRNNTKLQAAYLYQIIKYCKHWLNQKGTKTTGSAPARKIVITRVYDEAVSELKNYPEIQRALGIYNRNKNDGVGARRDPTLRSLCPRAAQLTIKRRLPASPCRHISISARPRPGTAPSGSLMHKRLLDSDPTRKLFTGTHQRVRGPHSRGLHETGRPPEPPAQSPVHEPDTAPALHGRRESRHVFQGHRRHPIPHEREHCCVRPRHGRFANVTLCVRQTWKSFCRP